MIQIRINNVEFRETRSISGVQYYEIVLWTPNERYNKEYYYVAQGYRYVENDTFLKRGCVSISVECFKNPFNAMTLSIFEIVNGKIKRRQLMERVRELSELELMDYKEVKSQGIRYLKTLRNENF